MKSRSEIESRIRELLHEELDRRVIEAQKRLPHLCTHNIRHSLDYRKTIDGEPNQNYNRITSQQRLPVLQSIGLCGLGQEDLETWPMNICDEPIDAKRCPVFDPIQTKEGVLKSLENQIKDSAWLSANLPEVAALAWLIQDYTTVKVSWWKKFLYRFKRVKVSPAEVVVDPAYLLEPPKSV